MKRYGMLRNAAQLERAFAFNVIRRTSVVHNTNRDDIIRVSLLRANSNTRKRWDTRTVPYQVQPRATHRSPSGWLGDASVRRVWG